MTTVEEELTPAPAPTAPEPRPSWARRRLPSPGWIPFLLVAVVLTLTLYNTGVAYEEIAKFAGYTLFANTLPGLLIWRAARGRGDYLPFDAAFGTVIGFIVELPLYMACRQFDVSPYAVGAWPLIVFLLFLAVPRLRRHWRGNRRRLPAGTTWTLTLTFLWILALIGQTIFRVSDLVEPQNNTVSIDFLFQFALTGEFKHHVPLNTPWVTGTRLNYHWYVYAHGAATSWLTGIEPQTLMLRLLPLPMVAAFLVIVVAAVRQITGRFWPGNVALLLMTLGVTLNPFSWTGAPIFSGIFVGNLWVSPTQTYAALFFAAVVFQLAVIFQLDRAGLRRPAPWILLTLLVGAVAGAKATFLPMALCGLVFAVVVRGLFARSVGPELPALGITLAWFAFAQTVLYGDGSQGASVYPLQTAKWTPLGQALMGHPDPVDQWTPLLWLTGIGILAPAFGWAGMAGLLRREWRMQPIAHVMLGFSAAGVGGLWLVAHPGLSQTYFAQSATPYLAMASSVGLAALIPSGRKRPWSFIWLAAFGAVAVATGVVVVRQTIGADSPGEMGDRFTLDHIVWTYGLVLLIVAVTVLLVTLIAWRVRLSTRLTVGALAIAVLTAAVTSGTAGSGQVLVDEVTPDSEAAITGGHPPNTFPAGALEAGRWLRAHSDPRDIVATNSHCRLNIPGCDSRDFWVAAFSERQVVVQGWSYTEPAFASGGLWDRTLARSQFWDAQLLAENDAVFSDPTAENVESFTSAHNVRWLVALDRVQKPTNTRSIQTVVADPKLAEFATLRYRVYDIAIYEVR
ncbi:hypothetical protein ACQPZJ_18755 [Actinoplanes sp. CA-054009]